MQPIQLPETCVVLLKEDEYPIGMKRLLAKLRTMCEGYPAQVDRLRKAGWEFPKAIGAMMHTEIVTKDFPGMDRIQTFEKESVIISPLSLMNLVMETLGGCTLFAVFSRDWCEDPQQKNTDECTVMVNSEGRPYYGYTFRGYAVGRQKAVKIAPNDKEDYFYTPV